LLKAFQKFDTIDISFVIAIEFAIVIAIEFAIDIEFGYCH